MIRVAAKPEYPAFDVDVRKPGAEFLKINPAPTSDQFRKKSLWSKSARELHAAYSGICAYTAMYLPEQGSVDHFLPKALYPNLAYEWGNFRLASGRVNSSKGNTIHILDPFEIQNDWFFMDIPACLIKANPNLEKPIRDKISGTINSLRLNQDDNYVQERCNILIEYARDHVSSVFIQRRYPFLSKELIRQELDGQALKVLFKL